MVKSLASAALSVLLEQDASAKAERAQQVASKWQAGDLSHQFDAMPPDRPGRPLKPDLLAPSAMPKRRKAGNSANRIALLHAIAHIELNAIDLAYDIVLRFGASMPRDFSDDWVQVGADEGRHFAMLQARLRELGSYYGELPAHDGLWQSSEQTAGHLPARLAVVPMVLEARGLDVTPPMITRFENSGDIASAMILKTIYSDEVSHVAAGKKWFDYLAKAENMDSEAWFQALVSEYFAGDLKRPFNTEAREKAGLFPSFYEPLAGQ